MLLGISLLIERLAELDKATDQTSKDARALLTSRGVTDAVLNQAKGYLTEATIPAEETVTPAEEINAAIEEAETALWAWYLEWSKIARVAVKDGRLLARLGFGGRGRGGKEEEEEAETTPVAGAPGGGAAQPTD